MKVQFTTTILSDDGDDDDGDNDEIKPPSDESPAISK